MQGNAEVKAIKFDSSRYHLMDIMLEDQRAHHHISDEIDQTNTPWTTIHYTPDPLDELRASLIINGVMYYY